MKLTTMSNKSKLVIGGNMASFRLALSRVILLYLTCTLGSSLLYLDKRLYCEFDKTLAGPIHEEQGLDQGGVCSILI